MWLRKDGVLLKHILLCFPGIPHYMACLLTYSRSPSSPFSLSYCLPRISTSHNKLAKLKLLSQSPFLAGDSSGNYPACPYILCCFLFQSASLCSHSFLPHSVLSPVKQSPLQRGDPRPPRLLPPSSPPFIVSTCISLWIFSWAGVILFLCLLSSCSP